jgi:hypothetical protein
MVRLLKGFKVLRLQLCDGIRSTVRRILHMYPNNDCIMQGRRHQGVQYVDKTEFCATIGKD